MNPRAKSLWTSALRSGKYVQGAGKLRFTSDRSGEQDRFCCLGVLCDIAVQEGVMLPPERAGISRSYYYGAQQEANILPREVQEWAGIPGNPEIGHLPATSVNDSGRYAFDRIADLIDTYL